MFGSGRKPSRLGQWDGRRRSSRSDPLLWPVAWGRPVLLRLALVLLAALGVFALVYANGPPLPYRVGETLPHDVRARVPFEIVNEVQTAHRHDEVEPFPEFALAEPPLPPAIDRYHAGLVLLKRQQPVTDEKLSILQAEHAAYVENLNVGDHFRRGLALLLIVLLLTGVLVAYVARFQPTLSDSLGKIFGVCVLVLATLTLALALSRPPWHASLIPLTVAGMVLAIAYHPTFALMVSFSMALMLNVATGAQLGPLLVQMGGLGTAILLLREVRSRTRPVEVAAVAGLAYLAMTIATELLAQQPPRLIAFDALRHLLWSLLAGFILSGSLPLVERCFGVITDSSLLELADSSHPLLEELIRRAPGTYTHSMTVATLAEAAAEGIGANALLARVGSYYHDIGKMLKPHYFIENQVGENRHDHLEPALSTLVIIGHVKDGVELAKQYRLPRPIIDFIRQHHGTTLVEYFYREAIRLQEANGHGCGELEFAFRYPGPKPQSRETGIVMLADAVESASRALSAATPNSLRKLVHDLLMKRLLDGQFDESGLTLTELRRIEESLCKSLIALYHARIKYPAEPAPVRQGA